MIRMPSLQKMALGLDFDGSFISMVIARPCDPIPL